MEKGDKLDTSNPAYKHGHAGRDGFSPEYHSWASMMTRCYNPTREYFHLYGGRGITVCDRWKTFTNFLADMGARPEGKSLDRIDVNGNYEPENCRWATAKEQRDNIRPGKWKQAEEKMFAHIRLGFNTTEALEERMATDGVVLHKETVKELTRNLCKAGAITKQRIWIGKVGHNMFSAV